MQSINKNEVIIAAAGSGKTTLIVSEVLKKEEKVIIITYTRENLNEIKKKIIEKNKVIPKNVIIQTWFSFLLNEGVRPYQNYVYENKRINNISFVNGISTKFVNKTDISRYYLRNGEEIYTDKISEFVELCNINSDGAVINRLEEIYKYVYIDEVQDLSGYDLELIKLLFKSKIKVKLVGDIRQATYSTNNSRKNKKYKGDKIIDFFISLEQKKICKIYYKNESYRCNKPICDFADSLFPNLEKTISKNTMVSGHDGIFFINYKEVNEYIKKYNPQILRYDKRSKLEGYDNILNFGQSKGLTFERVLIIPNGPMKKFLKTGDISNIEPSKSKIYVALTRAKYSVAILL